MNTYRSSLAYDFNNVDFHILDARPTLVAPTRKLWDLNADYVEGRFICPTDAIYSFSACFYLTGLTNVDRVLLHLYQNGELWATLVDTKTTSGAARSIQAVCPADGLYSNGDYFEVIIELQPLDPELSCSAVLSGSREKSFMGYDILMQIQPSEIDSAD